MIRRLSKGLFLSAFVMVTRTAHAAPSCASVVDGAHAVDGVDAGERLAFVRAQLEGDARHARLWTTSWSLFGTLVPAGGILLAFGSDTADRRIIWLAQSLPAAGFPFLAIVDPLAVLSDSRDLDRADREAPPTSDALCERLHLAERFLQHDADDEIRKRNFVAHLLGILANVVSSTVIVVGTRDWVAGLTNGASGIAVSELSIATLPTGSRDTLERYRAGRLRATLPEAKVTIAASSAGLTITW